MHKVAEADLAKLNALHTGNCCDNDHIVISKSSRNSVCLWKMKKRVLSIPNGIYGVLRSSTIL